MHASTDLLEKNLTVTLARLIKSAVEAVSPYHVVITRETDAARQEEWLKAIKNASCNGCHQIGNKATREIPDAWQPYESSAEAWGPC